MTRLPCVPFPLLRPGDALVRALTATTLALTLAGAAQADSGRSLNDARNSVHQGTSPGVVLIPARKPATPPAATPAPAASAPAAAVPSGTAAAPATASPPKAAAAAAGAAPAKPGAQGGGGVGGAISGFFAGLRQAQPPSGDALHSAKRLTSDELGVPLPTAASTAASAPGSTPSR